MSAKPKAVSWQTFLLFRTGLFVWMDLFIKTEKLYSTACARVNMHICFTSIFSNVWYNTSRYYRTHLYSYTVTLKSLLFKSKNSWKTQQPVKNIRAVAGLQYLLSLEELCESFPKWGICSLNFCSSNVKEDKIHGMNILLN